MSENRHEPGPGSLAPAGLAEDLPTRWSRLRGQMDSRELTWLLAVRDESVTYLSGYVSTTFRMHSRPIVALLGHDDLHVVAAETEVDSVRLRAPGAIVHSYVEMDPPGPGLPDGYLQFAPHAARVLDAIISDSPGSVGVDGFRASWPPVGQLTDLMPALSDRRASNNTATVDASALVWACRSVKSAWEQARMRHTAGVLSRVFDVMPDRIRPGMTEREISREFSIAQLELGAHEVGPHGSVARVHHGLFGGPTDAVWHPGDLLYLDGAPIIDGYWADFCRIYAARRPSPSEREGYARAVAGLDAARELVAAGESAAVVGEAMRRAMRVEPTEVGFGRFGHGIGLHVPEPPSLHPDDPTTFQPDNTVCLEPCVRHDGLNFVVEETCVITDSGLDLISPAAVRSIIEL
ncbi:aminopeptidase P family protein [Phytoactinopolyspora alkaliphila]|uniref:Aminopeptidase P family protein n=1 Tax=Phytoactinopolyspora alkaliphila TaxID=1783498 RepID=A0A6N9YL54_9ACTN|nr:M24 family metallopeptidase [Phytoactinopolyspora alkaliphila]NED95609.1 aminopeptidase P family protein [Phytoactinopolyspora alkaliphila]